MLSETNGGPTPLYTDLNPSVLNICDSIDIGDRFLMDD